MARDHHFDTGGYDPLAYWTARAERCAGDLFQTVCGYGLSAERNRAMDRLQRFVLGRMLGRRVGGRQVLDFGCGAGRFTGWFLDRGARYLGVDLSPAMLENARRRHPGADFRLLEESRLAEPADHFDLAVSVTVLQHNPYRAQSEALDELLRVVRPGGLLCLLERIGPRRDAGTLFTLYPQPASEWIEAVTRGGRARLLRRWPVRWWILADAIGWLMRRLGLAVSPAMDRRLVAATAWLDPWLLPLVPAGRMKAAALLFEVRPSARPSPPASPEGIREPAAKERPEGES